MYSEKLLLKALASLKCVYEELYTSSNIQERMEVFESAMIQCDEISGYISSGDVSAATQKWNALMCFSNDSIGPSEQFLNKYMPLKQKIINFGLQ